MSGTFPAKTPECLEAPSESIDLVIAARGRDLGGFEVRRVLPSSKRRLVGQVSVHAVANDCNPAVLP